MTKNLFPNPVGPFTYHMLHVCPYALVNQKWWQNISKNLFLCILVPLVREGVLVEVWKAWCRVGSPEEKDKFNSNLCPTYFAAIKIWSELCCQSMMGHLPQLAAKCQAWRWQNWSFRSMHLISQKKRSNFSHPRYTYFPATDILCRTMLPINLQLGTSSSTICQFWALHELVECFRYW